MSDLNFQWASRLIGGLAAAGAAHAVISPGARSTPLALACLRHPELITRVLLDERGAAFYALGLAKASDRAVILVATSGSAIANWHPAVVEAARAAVPLILLSADRPPEHLGCGANQTTAQIGMFGPHLRALHALPPPTASSSWLDSLAARAMEQAAGPPAGPVQINLPLPEPLVPQDDIAPPQTALVRVRAGRLRLEPAEIAEVARRLEGGKGIIVCGASPVPAVPIAQLAAALDVPVIADPLSGLRFGPHDRSRVVADGDLVFRGRGLAEADWVLRFGAFPVSRPVGEALGHFTGEQLVVAEAGDWPDPVRRATHVFRAEAGGFAAGLADAVRVAAAPGWCAGWTSVRPPGPALPPEAVVIRGLLAALPENGLLFSGNSMAIRDLDAFSGLSAKSLTVAANRGVSGIDGAVSTCLGMAASGRFSGTIGVIGDLTFLHHLGGLAARGPDAVLCVLDNGGGAIFGHLPQAGLPEFEIGWRTPQGADLAAAAAVWGIPFAVVSPDHVEAAVAQALAAKGTRILVIPLDAADSLARYRAVWNFWRKECP